MSHRSLQTTGLAATFLLAALALGSTAALAAANGCLACHPAVQSRPDLHHSAQCTDCHLGNAAATTADQAHAGLVRRPGDPSAVEQTCGRSGCHQAKAHTFRTSLHATVQGLKHGAVDMLGAQRGGDVGNQRCDSCHATCEDCHLNLDAKGRPVDAHNLVAKVPTANCQKCHDQTGTCYSGHAPQYAPSVHAKAGMTCADCHGGEQVHGSGKVEQHMSDLKQPKCEDCHAATQTEVVAHKLHEKTLDCSACHVAWYYNCYGCHGYDKDGNAMGYTNLNTNRYLARRKDNGKLAAVVHVPMSQEVGGDAYRLGAWVVKDRHSVQKGSLGCQDCHLNAQVFVMDNYREAPFLGSVPGEFVPKADVTGKILIFRSHAKLLGGTPKPGQTPDSVCLKCHQ